MLNTFVDDVHILVFINTPSTFSKCKIIKYTLVQLQRLEKHAWAGREPCILNMFFLSNTTNTEMLFI